jgi:S-disulfanyl-L-cysteine oxidoreductase SoxD
MTGHDVFHLARMSRFLLFLAAPFLIARIAQAQSTDSTAGKSVWQGVYTEEQATRGDTEHQNNCSSCHGTEKYSGDNFTKNWVGRTVFDLFDQIRTTMPDDNPDGLSAQQYKDVVAYILKTNGIPAGTDSLPSDPEAMRLLKIDAKPNKQTALRPMYHPHAHIPATATR